MGRNRTLELSLNQVGGIFKLDKEATEEDCTLQAALLNQVRKPNYENRGTAAQDCTVPKKNSNPRNQKSGSQDIDKLTQLVLDMKAEMGSMCKAMIRSRISFDGSSKEQKAREPSANGKQNDNFAGTAKIPQEEEQEGQSCPTFSCGSRRAGKCL
jgi:hypothetical protein